MTKPFVFVHFIITLLFPIYRYILINLYICVTYFSRSGNASFFFFVYESDGKTIVALVARKPLVVLACLSENFLY